MPAGVNKLVVVGRERESKFKSNAVNIWFGGVEVVGEPWLRRERM
jgi:hypothetical protein